MKQKEIKSILKDDCDRVFHKFEKLANQLGALNKGISDEYLMSLPKNERDFLMERAIKLHLQFLPLIYLQNATSKYLEFIKKTLDGLHEEPKKDDNESGSNNGSVVDVS